MILLMNMFMGMWISKSEKLEPYSKSNESESECCDSHFYAHERG